MPKKSSWDWNNGSSIVCCEIKLLIHDMINSIFTHETPKIDTWKKKTFQCEFFLNHSSDSSGRLYINVTPSLAYVKPKNTMFFTTRRTFFSFLFFRNQSKEKCATYRFKCTNCAQSPSFGHLQKVENENRKERKTRKKNIIYTKSNW